MLYDFGMGFRWPSGRSLFAADPLLRREVTWPKMPAVDVVENEKGYEITADLPGMDEKNIEVKVSDGVLTMKGERQEEKEEKKKDYDLQERSFGSFQRSFELPESVDADKIEASFTKRRSYSETAQKGRGAKAREEDRGQGRVNGCP